jgi:hypothetical protein
MDHCSRTAGRHSEINTIIAGLPNFNLFTHAQPATPPLGRTAGRGCNRLHYCHWRRCQSASSPARLETPRPRPVQSAPPLQPPPAPPPCSAQECQQIYHRPGSGQQHRRSCATEPDSAGSVHMQCSSSSNRTACHANSASGSMIAVLRAQHQIILADSSVIETGSFSHQAG